MAFKLRIPPEYLPEMKMILNLDSNNKGSILSKLHEYKPSIYNRDILSLEEFKEFPEITKLLVSLFKLYHSLQDEQRVKDIDDFVSQLIDSFLDQTDIEENDERLIPTKIFLRDFLISDLPLFYFEKAINLLIERSKLIEHTRIISDVRPIFKEDNIEYPNYCLIIHNLRIQYSKDL